MKATSTIQYLYTRNNLQASLQESILVWSRQSASPELHTFLPYLKGKVRSESKRERKGAVGGGINIGFPHLCTVNPDLVQLLTLTCQAQPAGSSKHGCYGKSTSGASEKTEILTSLHMIPSLVTGSAGSSGPVSEVRQIASSSPANV